MENVSYVCICFRVWYQIIQIYIYIILLINTDCHFKASLASYICFNFSKFPPKNSHVANEQKNRSVMNGNSRAKKVILGSRVRKVRNNRIRKERARQEACEARDTWNTGARRARSMWGTRHLEYGGHKAHEEWEHVGHEAREVREHVRNETRSAREHMEQEAHRPRNSADSFWKGR